MSAVGLLWNPEVAKRLRSAAGLGLLVRNAFPLLGVLLLGWNLANALCALLIDVDLGLLVAIVAGLLRWLPQREGRDGSAGADLIARGVVAALILWVFAQLFFMPAYFLATERAGGMPSLLEQLEPAPFWQGLLAAVVLQAVDCVGLVRAPRQGEAARRAAADIAVAIFRPIALSLLLGFVVGLHSLPLAMHFLALVLVIWLRSAIELAPDAFLERMVDRRKLARLLGE